MSSGGKDSTLALDRALRRGLEVGYLVNIYDGPSQRVPFHGTRQPLIAAQAAALGLEHVAAATDEDNPYEPVFLDTLAHLREQGVEGIVFGNIHLADVREWYETRVRRAGLEHVDPLWGDAPAALLHEVVQREFRATVVSVDLKQGAADLLGRTIDAEFEAAVAKIPNLDPCGERGEYHTYVWDGPTFRRPVLVETGAIREERGHRLLDLEPVANNHKRGP